MNQLTIVHKKSNNQQKIVSNENKVEEYENKREGHGRSIALTRKVFWLENSDTFYVESESTNNIFYFVRYNPDVFEWCSCPDNSYRGNTFKHIFGVITAIKKSKLIEVDKLPSNVKRDNMVPESYRDDDYDF